MEEETKKYARAKSARELSMKMVEYQIVNRNPIVLPHRLRGLEDIAHSPDGVYHFFLEIPVHLVS